MKNKETLEEVAVNCWAEGNWDNRDSFTDGFVEGAKWQQERMYSDEEVLIILEEFKRYLSFGDEIAQAEWFEQFKKK